MIKPQKNDIWVAPGFEGGQVVYRILATFDKKVWSGKHRKNIKIPMVSYQIRNTLGEVSKRNYSVSSFLNKPVGPHGGVRRLAVRPLL